MCATSIDYSKLYSADLPDPAPRWAPFPKYYFVGGNNDPEQIPIEGLIEAAASVLRREGSKLAIYNLGLGPLGYPALRKFVADKAKRQRGIDATIDDILITTGSGQGLDMISRLLINPGGHCAHRGILLPGRDQPVPQAGRQAGGNEIGRGRNRYRCIVRSTRRHESPGYHPKFIYTIPTVQNPTASILPLERRRALIALAREYMSRSLRMSATRTCCGRASRHRPRFMRSIPAA